MCAFDSSSLNDITESNHTLSGTYFFDGTFKRLAYCIDRLLELDRTQKIILALQDKDSLLQYLANIPVELIPEVWHFLFGVMPIHVSTNISIYCIQQCDGGICLCFTPIIVALSSLIQRGKETTNLICAVKKIIICLRLSDEPLTPMIYSLLIWQYSRKALTDTNSFSGKIIPVSSLPHQHPESKPIAKSSFCTPRLASCPKITNNL